MAAPVQHLQSQLFVLLAIATAAIGLGVFQNYMIAPTQAELGATSPLLVGLILFRAILALLSIVTYFLVTREVVNTLRLRDDINVDAIIDGPLRMMVVQMALLALSYICAAFGGFLVDSEWGTTGVAG